VHQEESRAPFNYNDSIQQANEFLQRGDKKKAIALFKEFLMLRLK
jgi:hypothetical protein